MSSLQAADAGSLLVEDGSSIAKDVLERLVASWGLDGLPRALLVPADAPGLDCWDTGVRPLSQVWQEIQ